MVGGKEDYCVAAVSLESLKRRVAMNPTRVEASRDRCQVANTLKQTTQCNHRTASFLCVTADIESAIPAYNTPFNKGVTNQEKSVSGSNQDGQVA
jgi:hypothetical protein